ncbi:MAG: stage II sporulation protein R [Clostridia bacterium]|nr:stage II sporulation protein R [Clostridia bacterium]
MDKKVKAMSLALACGVVFSMLLSFARFNFQCGDIRNSVLRLHILANSDSTADQHQKLLVRDAIIIEAQKLFAHCKTKEDALNVLDKNRDRLLLAARGALNEGEKIEMEIGKADFETRVYEDFTLPAGEYDALKIKIGEAEGQNWWCIMFPALCIGAADAQEEFLEPRQAEIIKGKEKYKIRFKAVEIFEEIRNILKF